MLARTLAALVLLLAACPKGSTVTSPPPGGGSAAGSGTDPGTGSGTDPGTGSGSGSAETPRPAGPKLGEPCGPDDTCGEGACVKYRGIAGARGPEFTSCEIRCDQGNCREGRKCITIADGPGQVCR